MRRLCLAIVLLIMPAAVDAGSDADSDASVDTDAGAAFDMLGRALAEVDRDRTDLGYRPRGYWTRFPVPASVPHLLPFFTDLFQEPLHIHGYTVGFGAAVEEYLGSAYRSEHDDAGFKLLYYLGISRRQVGFRDYSANLLTPDSTSTPFRDALESLYHDGGRLTETVTFGQRSHWLDDDPDLVASIDALPHGLRIVLGALVRELAGARSWWEIAFRNVPADLRLRVFPVRRLGETQPDGTVYYPEIDDVAARLDEPSLLHAAIKAVAAVERARAQLDSLFVSGALREADLRSHHVDLSTPFGRILVLGSTDDEVSVRDVFLLVDLGGDDHYRGSVGATSSPLTPISVALDCAGDDTYVCDEDDLPSQGAGVLGVGVLWDREGDDTYTTRNMGQGAALFGVGVLMDEAGEDRYVAHLSAQGAGFFGVGLLLDGSGDDRHELHGDGQGFGGVAGVGVLADADGNDVYYCEPYAEKVGRADYHSDYLVATSNAQGVGSGRRGDGGDGHSWAGGLGVLVDLAGEDRYEAGNWSQGTGYWFGTGLLYDGGGDDLYRSVYFTQASGAHYAIGAIVDEGGDDRHELFENAGAGIAFGWDYVHALLFDREGDDHYQARIISLGLADIRSNAFLVDLAGDDTYQLDRDQAGFGASDFRDDYREPVLRAPYNAFTASFGFLLDGGGRDRYLVRDPDTDRVEPHPAAGDDRIWLRPEPGSADWGAENFGVGLDCEGGVVPEWERFAPRRRPPSP